ncbi:MAG: LppX_LprAFG lipoprotein [Dermatophilaceae bacterium]
MPRLSLAAGAVVLAFALAGCSGDEGSAEAEAPAGPQEQLAAAREVLESTDAMTIELTGTDVPTDVNGVRSATGVGVVDGDTIKFAGDIEGRINGVTATVALICIGPDAYMKLFTPDYAPVDLDELGAPNPTTFLDPEAGLSSLIGATTDLAEGERTREGREILRQVTGTLPGDRVEALLRLGAPDRTFDVTYGLTDENELRTAVLEGEFYDGTESTYTLLLTDYGQAVPIERPTGAATDAPSTPSASPTT